MVASRSRGVERIFIKSDMTPEGGAHMQEHEMQPLPLDEVLAKAQVLMDYYVKLSANKFIKVAKAGTSTPVDSILRYKTKNLPCVYVRIEDYLAYIRETIDRAGSMASVSGLSGGARLSLLQDAMSAVYREAEIIGFDDEVLKHAKLVHHGTMTYIAERPALGEIVAKFTEFSEKGTKHAMMVSVVSTMLGVAHGWTLPATLEKLALGGLLHDVGKLKVPKTILDKPYERMSGDERLIYASHCEVGRQMLQMAKVVHDDVGLIVFQHHERSDGSGFPQGLKDHQIFPLARIVGLANELTKRVEAFNAAPTEQIVKAVVNQLEANFSNKFNKEHLKALRKLLEKDFQASA